MAFLLFCLIVPHYHHWPWEYQNAKAIRPFVTGWAIFKDHRMSWFPCSSPGSTRYGSCLGNWHLRSMPAASSSWWWAIFQAWIGLGMCLPSWVLQMLEKLYRWKSAPAPDLAFMVFAAFRRGALPGWLHTGMDWRCQLPRQPLEGWRSRAWRLKSLQCNPCRCLAESS